MPRAVDHDQRRREVALAATTLIARDGIDGATVRDIAKAAGYSTKIVSSYFSDKRELLLLVYRSSAERTRNRLTEARALGGDDIFACVDALLPLDGERRTDWAVIMAFWGMALSDPAFSREQRRRVRSVRQFLSAVIENAVAVGQLPDDTDAEQLAADLLTAVTGIAAQVHFDPSYWTTERQRALVVRTIGRELTAATGTTTALG